VATSIRSVSPLIITRYRTSPNKTWSGSMASEPLPFGTSAFGNDKNAPASVIPGAAWLASIVVAEGVETGLVVSYWASSDADRREWPESGWSGSGERFHRADVVIGDLRRGTRSRLSTEVGGRVKTRDVVPLGLACKP